MPIKKGKIDIKKTCFTLFFLGLLGYIIFRGLLSSPRKIQSPPSASFLSLISQSLALVVLFIIGVGGVLALLSTIGYWIYSLRKRKLEKE